MSIKYVQTNTLSAGSGNIIGATSIVLTNLVDIYGNILTMADFGSEGYITLEPDTTNEEAATFTGIVSNANGTYTLTGVSSALAKSPYTETSGLVRGHAGGTKVVVTDNVAFWNTFTNKHNNETVDGQWTFTNTPIVPGTVSDASTTVKGVSKTSVASDTANNPIVVGTNDPRVPIAYAIDSVGTDSYAITPSPAIIAYTAGQMFTFQAGTANTGACTLNVSGLGAKTIKKNVSTDLATGDILVNQIVTVVYDGTNMQLVSIPSGVINSYTNKFSTGVTTKAMSDANGATTVIAHGLGVAPNLVRLSRLISSSSVGCGSSQGQWVTGGTNSCIFTVAYPTSSIVPSNSSTYAIVFSTADGSQDNRQSGTLSVDATNITITWTKAISPSGTGQILWSAQY